MLPHFNNVAYYILWNNDNVKDKVSNDIKAIVALMTDTNCNINDNK